MNQISKTARIHGNVILGDNIMIGENVEIQSGTIVNSNVSIGENTFIGANSIIGEVSMSYYNDRINHRNEQTTIGKNSVVRSGAIIYEGVTIGDNFQSGHRINIREKTVIGRNCSVGTLCELTGHLKIGNYVRLHSNVLIGEKTEIEDYVWIYPYVVLTNNPCPPMGELKGVVVKEYAQIATAATVLPGVIIGKNALVGAGTLVRKNVSEEEVVVGNPGKVICSVRDIKNDRGERVYPWKEYLKDYRGYPWQEKE
ncbi:MAG: DapH/DapD/GlmU-related protein [Alkaliphilus sp.]